MSWGGVEAIPLLPGESRRAAVDRVYSDGWVLEIGPDGPGLRPMGGEGIDHTHVTRAQRAWMRAAAELLEELRPGWTVVNEIKAEGRRWPWAQDLEHSEASMRVELMTRTITFHHRRSRCVDDQEWRFWWRTIRAFAAWPAAIFHPDTSEIVATSLSARAARERYNWL